MNLFDTLTFNQQNCQHPELHTATARRSFRPHHPSAANSCGDCSILPRILFIYLYTKTYLYRVAHSELNTLSFKVALLAIKLTNTMSMCKHIGLQSMIKLIKCQ